MIFEEKSMNKPLADFRREKPFFVRWPAATLLILMTALATVALFGGATFSSVASWTLWGYAAVGLGKLFQLFAGPSERVRRLPTSVEEAGGVSGGLLLVLIVLCASGNRDSDRRAAQHLYGEVQQDESVSPSAPYPESNQAKGERTAAYWQKTVLPFYRLAFMTPENPDASQLQVLNESVAGWEKYLQQAASISAANVDQDLVAMADHHRKRAASILQWVARRSHQNHAANRSF